MELKTYAPLALRTEADQEKILNRLVVLGPQAMRLDNAARGLANDAGEVSSAVMRFIEYGKELDAVNLLEEVGDVMWRLNQVCAAASELLGRPFTIEMALDANIAKLSARYPDKYSDDLAGNRNRDAERTAMAEVGGRAARPDEERVNRFKDDGKSISKVIQDGHGFGHSTDEQEGE